MDQPVEDCIFDMDILNHSKTLTFFCFFKKVDSLYYETHAMASSIVNNVIIMHLCMAVFNFCVKNTSENFSQTPHAKEKCGDD